MSAEPIPFVDATPALARVAIPASSVRLRRPPLSGTHLGRNRSSHTAAAYHTHRVWQARERTIYTDGRAHPPDYVAHTWQGFSTAKLGLPHAERDHHPLTTTNLKMGYIRRNGVARGDRARVTEHFMRHGTYLTIVSIVTDPVY